MVNIPNPTKYLKVIVYGKSAINGASGLQLRCNNDSGASNYARRFTYNNGSTVTSLSTDSSFIAATTTQALSQPSTMEVLFTNADSVSDANLAIYTSGSTTDTRSGYGSWKNTTTRVTSINVDSDVANGIAAGSSIVILGHN